MNAQYYRFTDDGYLLRSEQDTVDVTYPYSIFRVSAAIDTLYSGHDQDSIAVRIDTTLDFRSEIDSTNLLLSVERVLPYGHSAYLYKIGDASGLVGARVGSLKVGDADFLTRVSTEDETSIPSRPIIEIYPFPLKSTGTIRVKSADVGLHTITLFDLVGRQIARTQFTASWQEQEVFFNEWPESAGYYVLVLETPSGQRVSRSMIYMSN